MGIILTIGPVARGRNGVIGAAGRLPWRLATDLKLFKRLTVGKPVIMGRKTFESLPAGALGGRTNIVLSRDGAFAVKGALVCGDFGEALGLAREQAAEDGASEICVIGGAVVFAVALPKAKRMYLTEVEASPAGDVFFPSFDESAWREVEREPHSAGPGDEHAFTFRLLEHR